MRNRFTRWFSGRRVITRSIIRTPRNAPVIASSKRAVPTAIVAVTGSVKCCETRAVKARTNSAVRPVIRSARIVQPASSRPSTVSDRRNALTTSPPIEPGRQRLKNAPSKNRRMKVAVESRKPIGRASEPQRTAATTWTRTPAVNPANHQRQSAVRRSDASVFHSTFRRAKASRSSVPATRPTVPATDAHARERRFAAAGRSRKELSGRASSAEDAASRPEWSAPLSHELMSFS